MNEHDDVMCQVRESFSGLRMDMTVEEVFTRSRARRRRRIAGFTAAATATVGAAAAITLTLGGPAPARPGSPPPSPSPSPGTARLAAFSVTSGPGASTTLILYKDKGPRSPRLHPNALRLALARQGIPALVTVGTFCRTADGTSSGVNKVVRTSNQADRSAMVIDGQAIPPGTRLSIGLFPNYTRMLLIKDGAPLKCSSTSDQPAVHITPTGTPIRTGKASNHISR